MDKFAVHSAAQRMEYWLKIDPEPFSKVSKQQISDLQNVLLKIQDLLGDNNEVCFESHAEIKEAANNVEDVFDSFVYNVRSVDSSVGIAKIGASIFNIMSPEIFSFKMESIQQRLRDAVLKLGGKANGVHQRRLMVSDCHAHEGRSMYEDDEYVVGLGGDIEEMVHQLTNRENEVEDPPYLFFIVGGPSSGKTTLARQLYNNSLVRQHFHNFIWFDQSRIFLHSLHRFQSEIFEEVTRKYSIVHMNEETWITDIGKCLIILDEIPCSLIEIVIDLLQAFPTGLNGTKIIITGSNEEYDVFKNDLRCYFHQVKGKVNEEQGWDLLCHLTFDKHSSTTISEMLAKKMLRICEGQPISIKLLSGVLSAKGMVDDVKDVYELSYMNLGYNLKACFLYLGVFPCKYEIHAGVYRRMWMAEGFGGNSSEDEVMEYLEELNRRYLIHIVKRNLKGRIKIFQVPSLVYEFCITKAREENFLDIDSHQFGTSAINSRKVLFRSRWCMKNRDSYIRSLSLMQLQDMYDNRIRIGTIYKHLKLLRVLNLQGVYTSDNSLPEEIGMLVHLSYLGIRNTNIEQLPKSIGNLTKLWTLDWRDISSGKLFGGRITVPNEIWKMEQLRHIYIPKDMLHKDIFKLLTLNKLHTLWGMRVGDWLADDAKMWNFPNLQKLYLFNICWRHQLDTIFGSLMKSPNLRKLKLAWTWFNSTMVQSLDIDTLNKHCCKLSALILVGPIKKNDHGIRFPSNLVFLELKWSNIEGYDPFLLIGNCCPKLKVLKFLDNAYRGTEMRCSADAYPCLIELLVDSMYELETWVIETGALPRLEKLFIYNTRKLTRLPEGLRFVTSLRELILESMPRSFCEKLVHVERDNLTNVADKLKGEDFNIIQHVAVIKFYKIIDEQKDIRDEIEDFY